MMELLKNKTFWIGVVVGLVAYYAYLNYYAAPAAPVDETTA